MPRSAGSWLAPRTSSGLVTRDHVACSTDHRVSEVVDHAGITYTRIKAAVQSCGFHQNQHGRRDDFLWLFSDTFHACGRIEPGSHVLCGCRLQGQVYLPSLSHSTRSSSLLAQMFSAGFQHTPGSHWCVDGLCPLASFAFTTRRSADK